MRLLGLVEGVTLDQDARDQIAKRWNWLRIVAAAPALPMALGVALFVHSKLYLGVGLMALVLGISIQQRHDPRPAALLAESAIPTATIARKKPSRQQKRDDKEWILGRCGRRCGGIFSQKLCFIRWLRRHGRQWISQLLNPTRLSV